MGHANRIAQSLIENRSAGELPPAVIQPGDRQGAKPGEYSASDFRPMVRFAEGETPPEPRQQTQATGQRFEAVREFAQNAGQFAAGAADAWRNNFTIGLSPRTKSSNPWFNKGQTTGDMLSMAQGVLEFTAGAGGEAGSIAAEAVAIPASGGTAFVLVPAASAAATLSASVATHGAMMAAHASKEFNGASEAKPVDKPIERNVDGEKIADHYFHPGTIKNETTGINGAHSKELFEKALAGQGKIIKSRPIAGFDGMELVEYQLYEKNSGTIVTNALRNGKPYRKTVIDPAKWPKERIRELAETLFKGLPDGYHRPNLNGVRFEGRVTNGEVEWFGVLR